MSESSSMPPMEPNQGIVPTAHRPIESSRRSSQEAPAEEEEQEPMTRQGNAHGVQAGRAGVCPDTGLYLVPAHGGIGWRVAKEQYVRSGGILAVRVNKHVGRLADDMPDRRGRYDTLGRTVYFGKTAQTSFAEVLQDFRSKRIAVEADAAAAGYTFEEYVDLANTQADENGVDRPWAISGKWQVDRCLHKVAMPSEGWWVRANHHATINQVATDLAAPLGDLGVRLLTLGDLGAESRAVTTLIAEHIRNQNLFDGSRPLGIEFPSKMGYGPCWAWWDRRADDGLTPGTNDPKTLEDLNVDGRALRKVAGDWGLEILPGRPGGYA